ncbi:hypothetical protein OEIGOIKO_06621 [Streptomyces chrestomyceticus JCM 4735]|uniref:Tetratricopeptide repeat protein n=1 Tax=Streptomyces chrestomyceticus JCM 4735 TaxID=1306181 RepID=A0A7U9L0H5_9ACTN|nr:hypothetical protein OEIGOIKO_06621 [Streptomyces chrestomyceticus JCM 4735]
MKHPKAPRSVRGRLAAAVGTVLLACGITVGGLALGDDGGRAPALVPAPPSSDVPVGRGTTAGAVTALQARLRARPGDWRGWAQLGAAYVEQARTTGDPTRYPQAERALGRSLALRPQGNDAGLAGRGALAAARHDFRAALRDADAALAVNPYSERGLAVRVDALVELGRYQAALAAARHADAVHPGLPAFTRLAYVRELHGDADGARKVLDLALRSAGRPDDIAYVATALGNLARAQGQYPQALRHYAAALRAVPGHLPALEGRARTYAARGQLGTAARELREVVRRYPLPGPLAALGEVYEARGERAVAQRQYTLAGTWADLARANGVAVDLETALVEADHGDRQAALRAARAEWSRRHTVHTADALAWALHRTGQDRAALPYAERAAAPGFRDAAFLYHRGMIERALGRTADARRDLSAALRLDPGFSPTGAAAARSALAALEAGR